MGLKSAVYNQERVLMACLMVCTFVILVLWQIQQWKQQKDRQISSVAEEEPAGSPNAIPPSIIGKMG